MGVKRFDCVVFIGRFNPLHCGHLEVLVQASRLADRVVVLVGSAGQPRNIKNPFSFQERRSMIKEAFEDAVRDDTSATFDIRIQPLQDFKSDDNVWAANVQRAVDKELGWSDKPPRIALIGHGKDETSFYLHMFPQWELIDHSMNEVVHATDIRHLYFTSNVRYLKEVLPTNVFDFLQQFKRGVEYGQLESEYEFIQSYRKSWEVAPYAPTFVTVDAVVVQSAHVLLIKRRAEPGRGLWALPGGFINQTERIEAAMLRELKEETKIKLPPAVLRGSITGNKVFDAPDRSLRGRTITHAFFLELPVGELPEVKGGDDAEKAKWVPLAFVREEELYEDHYSIITHFIGKL